MLHSLVLHYKSYRNLEVFYTHSLIRLISESLFDVFSSIYIFQLFLRNGFTNQHAIAITMLFLASLVLCQFVALLFFPRILFKQGLKLSIFEGNIFLILFFLLLQLASFNILFLIPAVIINGLYAAFYWVPYHIYFTNLSDDKKQGEEFAFNATLSIVASFIGPLLGGFIIISSGFSGVFILVILLLFLGNIPIMYLPHEDIRISNTTKQVDIAQIFTHDKKFVLAVSGYGVITVIAVYVWPLFIFPILKTYANLGFIGALSSLICGVAAISLGIIIDKLKHKKLLTIVSPFDSLIWILKAFVYTTLHVVIFTIIQAISLTGQAVAMESMIYERARHTDIVAVIFKKEFLLASSKCIFLFFLSLLIWFGFPLRFIFLVTAPLALLTLLYPTQGIE